MQRILTRVGIAAVAGVVALPSHSKPVLLACLAVCVWALIDLLVHHPFR